MKKILVILLAALMIFSLAACQTMRTPDESSLPDQPTLADQLHVEFEDIPEKGGLLLRYSEYRKLETNIINMRTYIQQLELQNQFLRQKVIGSE